MVSCPIQRKRQSKYGANALLGYVTRSTCCRRVYTFYNSAFKIGVQYQYSVPYAGIYRGMGIVAANGVSTLPKYCLAISGGLLLTAIVMDLIRVRLELQFRV